MAPLRRAVQMLPDVMLPGHARRGQLGDDLAWWSMALAAARSGVMP
jgi:hypothetical protein